MTARTLVVLRHAAAAQVPGLADRERPLTGEGERDARRAGETISGMGVRPDLVLCSPSVRTRRTAELALPGADIVVEHAVYEAYSDELLTLIRRSDPQVRTLLLVGHNPGVHQLVRDLTQEPGGPGFPPGSFTVIEVAGEWAELDGGRRVARWSPEEH
ncbi:phosphohistidine phosphatase [Streptosporangium becharense]|uniref:Phosphohistidine phosphatase n=1 Tax=Streptosporangium becharense TaxID=1816182 RepID=A0A7W9IGB1_9ACTN|nr:histidine phosphatase family protein [Streptosporangium becharense]MBB2908976.1 phosphohistidine phosphatase [Streptosporangium becharense]MBB5820006.1 phosphohistidine phosphatase [Streptosporangium becharense]